MCVNVCYKQVKVTSSWHEQLSRSSDSDTETGELSTPPLKHLFFHTLNEQQVWEWVVGEDMWVVVEEDMWVVGEGMLVVVEGMLDRQDNQAEAFYIFIN